MKIKADIDFELKSNERFISRCSCIIYNKDKSKILVFKIDGRDNYMLPGGRIEFGEDSLSAIKREIKEELNYSLDYSLKGIQEIFISKDDKNIMQYCFCYEAIYDGVIEEHFKSLDNNKQTFYWIDVNYIDKYNLVPKTNINIIKKQNKNIIHCIEN